MAAGQKRGCTRARIARCGSVRPEYLATVPPKSPKFPLANLLPYLPLAQPTRDVILGAIQLPTAPFHSLI
jgi:hypothetical protein